MVLKPTLTSTPERYLHRIRVLSGLALMCWCWTEPAQAVLLWSDLGTTLAHDSREGVDILSGAVRRDDTASDTLYFKFHVDPLSDVSTEEYFAAFQLYE